MPDPVPHDQTCPLRAQQPRTITALGAVGPVRWLNGDLETLALLGTELSEALFTVNNGAAMASGMGGLGRVQSTAQPFHLSQSRITLRFDANHPAQIYGTSGRGGPDAAVVVADQRGNIRLRIETNGGQDTRILCALDQKQDQGQPDLPLPQDGRTNVISLCAVRAAQQRWADCDTGHHINDLCQDAGVTRSTTLRHVGRNRASAVVPHVLTSFLSYLVERNIGHAPLVVGSGFVQGSLFRQGEVRAVGSVLWCQDGAQSFALDLAQVTAAWVTRFERMSQLELYGADGRAIAVITADPNSNLGHWNQLLASLPEVRSRIIRP